MSGGPSPGEFRKLLTRAVLVPPVLLGIVALVFLGLIMYLLSAAAAVDHSDLVILKANTLLKLLVDGETGMRGFLLADDPAFLEPYEFEENRSGPVADELANLVADNSEQHDRVAALRASI